MYLEQKEQPTPAASFLATIAEVTNHSIAAARKWVKGLAKPDVNSKILLSRHFGIPYDVLFPFDEKMENGNDNDNEYSDSSNTGDTDNDDFDEPEDVMSDVDV